MDILLCTGAAFVALFVSLPGVRWLLDRIPW